MCVRDIQHERMLHSRKAIEVSQIKKGSHLALGFGGCGLGGGHLAAIAFDIFGSLCNGMISSHVILENLAALITMISISTSNAELISQSFTILNSFHTSWCLLLLISRSSFTDWSECSNSALSACSCTHIYTRVHIHIELSI